MKHRRGKLPTSLLHLRVGRALLRLPFLALIAYTVYATLLFVAQRHILFPGQHMNPPPVVTNELDVERYWVSTSVGLVEAWYLPAGDTRPGPGPALIFTHGNGEFIDSWIEDFDIVREVGLGVMLVEYPGYGRSAGKPSQTTITEAVVAAYDTLAARNDVDASRIIAYGRSVGGGAASALVGERQVAALILQSTFTSARAFAKGLFVPSVLVRDPFDNLARIRSYTGPVLVAHGTRDDQIPYDHAVTLVQAASNGVLLSYDCVHDDCPPDWLEFWTVVTAFLSEHGLLSGS